jgi:hypothetical protein
MPAVSGNVVTLGIAKQTVKGTPAASPTYKLKLTGGDIAPVREIIQLAETDATRQQGKNMVVSSRVEGSPEFYVRPTDFALLAYFALGAVSTSGASDYTHTITPANAGPYFTLWKAIGGSVLVDQYSDCRITGLRIRGQAGQPLTCGIDVVGLVALLGQTDPVLAPVTQDPLVYPQVTVTKGGAAPGTVESFEINYANNGVTLQGDKQLNPYEYVWGELAVSGTLTMLFESDATYRAFHTGSTSGTVPSTTIFSETLSILAQASATLSVEAVMAAVAYDAYPVPPDPGGAPIRVAAGFRSQPAAAIGDYAKLIVKNQTATL